MENINKKHNLHVKEIGYPYAIIDVKGKVVANATKEETARKKLHLLKEEFPRRKFSLVARKANNDLQSKEKKEYASKNADKNIKFRKGHPYVIIDAQKNVVSYAKKKSTASKKLDDLKKKHPRRKFLLIEDEDFDKKSLAKKEDEGKSRDSDGPVKISLRRWYPYAIIDGNKNVYSSSNTKDGAKQKLEIFRKKFPRKNFKLVKIKKPSTN